VSQSNVEQVRAYVATQEEHHRGVSYQDEFRALCRKHGVEIDERYVWDRRAVCRTPLGLVSILSGRSQGGAHSSLALGWLVAGRWPEESKTPP